MASLIISADSMGHFNNIKQKVRRELKLITDRDNNKAQILGILHTIDKKPHKTITQTKTNTKIWSDSITRIFGKTVFFGILSFIHICHNLPTL